MILLFFEPFVKIYEFFTAIIELVADSLHRANSVIAIVVDVLGTIGDVISYSFPEILATFVFAGIVVSILIRFFID